MMDRVRGWIGLSTSSANSATTSSNEDVAEKREMLMERQRQQLMIDCARLEDVETKLNSAVKSGKSAEAKRLIQERNKLQQAVRLQQGKINNLIGTQSVLATADENLLQAELMRDGAKELTHIQKQTEAIDLDGVVDLYRDATQQTHNFSQRLADPFDDMNGLECDETGLDIDDELQMLMQQAADEKAAQLQTMDIPPAKTSPTAGSTTIASKRTKQQENPN
jgi:hypothetical protein